MSDERGPYRTLRDVYDALESGDTVKAALAGAQWVEDHMAGAIEHGELDVLLTQRLLSVQTYEALIGWLRSQRVKLEQQLAAQPPAQKGRQQ
jgi:hypothetical protein